MPNHHQGSPDELRALESYVKLVRAAEALVSRLHGPLQAAEGLSISQFGALEALHHRGPMCQADLARKLLRSGGNLTMVVDNLEKRGLVKRVRSTTDRRYVTVHLTDEGATLIARIFPGHAAKVAAEMAVLTPDEQGLLSGLCKRVGLGAKGDGECSSEEACPDAVASTCPEEKQA